MRPPEDDRITTDNEDAKFWLINHWSMPVYLHMTNTQVIHVPVINN